MGTTNTQAPAIVYTRSHVPVGWRYLTNTWDTETMAMISTHTIGQAERVALIWHVDRDGHGPTIRRFTPDGHTLSVHPHLNREHYDATGEVVWNVWTWKVSCQHLGRVLADGHASTIREAMDAVEATDANLQE